MTEEPRVVQRSISPRTDLREMLRDHIVGRSLACMEDAARRRESAIAGGDFIEYRKRIRASVAGFYSDLPVGANAAPPEVTPVSTFDHDGFRIENVLFDSFAGWQVNATVYVPKNSAPPFTAVVVPVGHSGKQFACHQLPCQFFARSGFMAVSFDPPGMSGEKQPGNDHFADGVCDYLIGKTSSRYFVADALRCIDYLQTRGDVDFSRGVAMTGVSGGGTTTTLAALLDDRISVIGPCCCVAPLADLDITQCYAGCPETHMWRRYADGIDEVDLLCAAAPTPCLLMAGEADEVFHIGDTRRLADEVSRCYASLGAEERFGFFVDAGGHDYSLAQARKFTEFMARWLCAEPDRPSPDIPDEMIALLSVDELRCHPRTDVNMRTLAAAEADMLAKELERVPEAIRRAACDIAGVREAIPTPDAEVGEPFRVWCHDWRSVMLRPEPDIELPATLLTSAAGTSSATLLHIDDGGRHRLLHRHGLLARSIRFGDRDREGFNLLTVDVRGWGDTAPAMYPYEMAAWGSVNRYLAYASAALGDPVMAMRIRDALAALSWLRNRPEANPSRIIITGCGLGCIVALHAAVIDGRVSGVVAWDGLSSFRSLIKAKSYPWPADAFLPRVLTCYDLPELAASAPCPVRLLGLRDGDGKLSSEESLGAVNVAVSPEASLERVISEIWKLAGV